MDETRTMSRISNNDELAYFVKARRRNLVSCYERLATEMAKFGESKQETIYRSLADDAERLSISETQSVSGTQKSGTAYVPLPANADFPDVASLWTPYTIWAFAVSNEVHLFEELVAANISIVSSHLRSALAVEARACLDRAAKYREQRRIAFHSERLSDESARFPDIRRIDTHQDFAHVALAIERYFQSLLVIYDKTSGDLGDVIDAAGKAISYLEPVVHDATISRRLERPLKRLAKVTSSQTAKSNEATCGIMKIAIEADRIFDYYDHVFESAQDSQIVDASQHLSANVLGRLRAIRSRLKDAEIASGNPHG